MEQTTLDQKNNAPKFAFFYLLSLVALIFLAVSVGMIIFEIINKKIIDVLEPNNGFSLDALKFAISALVISAPIFYITSRQIYKSLFAGILDKDSGVRKWLTYFILFVASIVMLGWLIAVINNFLNGDLTMKFVLKSLTSVGISAAIFIFYYFDIRRKEAAGQTGNFIKIYFYSSLAVVIIVFTASLFFIPSPQQTRNTRIDQTILGNFSSLDNAIQTFYQSKQKLPKDLNELKSNFNYITATDMKDPVTGKAYDYKIVDKKDYQLCATFQTSNKSGADNTYPNNLYIDQWPHDAGYQCLTQNIKEAEFPKTVPAATTAPIK
jgi:hypothetical protein